MNACKSSMFTLAGNLIIISLFVRSTNILFFVSNLTIIFFQYYKVSKKTDDNYIPKQPFSSITLIPIKGIHFQISFPCQFTLAVRPFLPKSRITALPSHWSHPARISALEGLTWQLRKNSDSNLGNSLTKHLSLVCLLKPFFDYYNFCALVLLFCR